MAGPTRQGFETTATGQDYSSITSVLPYNATNYAQLVDHSLCCSTYRRVGPKRETVQTEYIRDHNVHGTFQNDTHTHTHTQA